MRPPRWRESDVWGQVAFYTGLGFIIPGAALGGYVLGWLLDKALHTAPALALVGALAGVAGGIFEILQILTRDEKRNASGPSKPGRPSGPN
ncbi:MAG TPA: AtpZ/AtpI family protein [Terriglobia bacterium]|nr:AtpZ/AtpI family protein [Terriglobia bacterium]